LIFFWSFFR